MLHRTQVLAPRRVAGLAALADEFDVLLCDVWGVIHNGVVRFPRAVEALQRFRARGGTVVLITNAPNPSSAVRLRLEHLAIPDSTYDAMVSSGDVTISLILERGDPRLFHIGPPDDEPLFRELAERGGRPPRRTDLAAADLVVCTGLVDSAVQTPTDYDEVLAIMRARGLELFCANPDIVVQVGETLVYCAGAIAERYAAAGGTVIQLGKPYSPIYKKALALAAAAAGKPVDRRRVLTIGDAMRTDVRGGFDQGLATCFVTSGIHREELYGRESPEQIDDGALSALFAAAGFTPTTVMTDLTW